MNGIKILMADDEPDVLEIMARKVAREGYIVTTAQDGEEAWEKIQKESPDIILMDFMMPKMDGLTVLKYLRENPPSAKRPPVIIVSARGEFGDDKKNFPWQAEYYITKPCQIEDIIKGIRLMVNLLPQSNPTDNNKKS